MPRSKYRHLIRPDKGIKKGNLLQIWSTYRLTSRRTDGCLDKEPRKVEKVSLGAIVLLVSIDREKRIQLKFYYQVDDAWQRQGFAENDALQPLTFFRMHTAYHPGWKVEVIKRNRHHTVMRYFSWFNFMRSDAAADED